MHALLYLCRRQVVLGLIGALFVVITHAQTPPRKEKILCQVGVFDANVGYGIFDPFTVFGVAHSTAFYGDPKNTIAFEDGVRTPLYCVSIDPDPGLRYFYYVSVVSVCRSNVIVLIEANGVELKFDANKNTWPLTSANPWSPLYDRWHKLDDIFWGGDTWADFPWWYAGYSEATPFVVIGTPVYITVKINKTPR